MEPPFLTETDAKVLENITKAFVERTYVRSSSVSVQVKAVSLVHQEPHVAPRKRSRHLQDGSTINKSMTAKLVISCEVKILEPDSADPLVRLIPNLLDGFTSKYEVFLETLHDSSETFEKNPRLTSQGAYATNEAKSKADHSPAGTPGSIVGPAIALSVAGTLIIVSLGVFCFVFKRRRAEHTLAIRAPIDQDRDIVRWATRNSQDAVDTSNLPLFAEEQSMAFQNVGSIQLLTSSVCSVSSDKPGPRSQEKEKDFGNNKEPPEPYRS